MHFNQGCLDMVNAQYAIELDTEGFTTIAFDPGHVETDSEFDLPGAVGHTQAEHNFDVFFLF
jgi:hypothetical protein